MSENNTSKVVVQFVGDASKLERTMKQVNSSMEMMGHTVEKSVFKAMMHFEMLKMAIMAVGKVTLAGGEDAIKYEAIMDNLGQRFGKSAQQFTDWADTAGKAMGFSKLQSADMANTLSVTLSQIATDQQDLTQKTIAMMEASAIIRSRTGRTMQDVSERIRSAMNQEADGADELGLNVRTNAIQMSDAFKKMSDGQAWKDLNTHQQKAILYQYILDQTAQNFGTTLADNTSLKVAQFTASLLDLRLSLGQAFLPIVNFALPYLNALVQWLTVAMGYVRVFMETLFGYHHDNGAGFNAQASAMKNFGGAVGDATKAQDKLNDSMAKGAKAGGSSKKDTNKKREGLANFDEIHTLPQKSDASSGGGAGAGGVGSGLGIPMTQATDATGGLIQKLSEAQQKVSEFAERFKTFLAPIVEVCQQIWNAIVTYVVGVFQQLNDWWATNGSYIGVGFKNLWNNFLYPVLKFLVEMIWGNVKGAIDGLVTFFEGLIQFIGGVFSGEWGKAFEGIWMMVKGAFEAIWNIISLLWLAEGFGMIKDGLIGIGKWFADFFSLSGEKSVVSLMDKGLKAIYEFFRDIFPRSWKEVEYAFGKAGKWITENLKDPISKILDDVLKVFKSKPSEWWGEIKTAFSSVASWFSTNVTSPIKNALSNIGSGALASLTSGLATFVNNNIRPALNKALDWADNIPGVDISWRMPQLYNGGITNGKMIAQIGDNVGGQEVVAPLDRLNNIIAQTMRSTLAMNSGGSNQPMEIVLKVGSTEFGRVAVDSINKLTKQEGRLALNI